MWFNKKKKTVSKISEFYLLKILVMYETQNQKNDLKEKTLTLWHGLRR